MNVLGIIAEYNPFHKGHLYQIKTLKEQTDADYVIIAMSGNFVQRGAPALMNKYARTQMALEGGADLVLELPVASATASAEYFAAAGVSLLHHTGVVTHLGFGVEQDNLPLLQKIARTLLENPPAFQSCLQQELKNGLSFPAARANALKATFSDSREDTEELQEILAAPNNILAIEYLKALSKLPASPLPCPLLRKGQGYHDTALSEEFSSASAIRSYIRNNHETFDLPGREFSLLSNYPYPFLFEDDFSQLLHYKLLTESPKTLSDYADSSKELANRIYRSRHSFESWTQFCELLKSKNTTYTRISRLFLHLILNVSSVEADVSYLRVLGLRKAASPLLSKIKEQGTLPLVTSLTGAEALLSPEAFLLLQQDITASDIYNLALTAKGGKQILSDYRHPLITL